MSPQGDVVQAGSNHMERQGLGRWQMISRNWWPEELIQHHPKKGQGLKRVIRFINWPGLEQFGVIPV